jgi:hypothetical protein
MTQVSTPLEDARENVREAMQKASPFVEGYARVGYAAKGVMYVLMGLLSAMAAIGAGRTMGSKGAMAELVHKPFGRIMLAAVALGILGYCLWQFIRAIEDPENEGTDTKGIGKRFGYFCSAVLHFGLVLAAAELVFGGMLGFGAGATDESGDRNARDWTAWLMSFPFGRVLTAGTGLGIAGYGIWKLYRAWKIKLDRRLSLGEMSSGTRRAVVGISRFGIAARGVIFVLLGILLAYAAWQSNPGHARGVGGALAVLERQPYGPLLLAAVALGLIAYGVYEFVRARYRRIDAA